MSDDPWWHEGHPLRWYNYLIAGFLIALLVFLGIFLTFLIVIPSQNILVGLFVWGFMGFLIWAVREGTLNVRDGYRDIDAP
jgi:hypothetical protein